MATSFEKVPKPSPWRRLAMHGWGAPSDPTIYGWLDVDVTQALRWIAEARETTGVHVTLTHLAGAAAARAISAHADVNAIVRRGRGLWQRSQVDVFFQVARDGGRDLSGAKLERVDEMSPLEIAQELRADAARVEGRRGALDRSGRVLERLPAFLVAPTIRLLAMVQYDLGLSLGALGVPADSFGSVMVTNVGSFGLERALVPLVPFSRCPVLVSIGVVRDGVVALDGRAVVRPVVTFGVTLDHRVVDGWGAGRLAAVFERGLADAYQVFGPPSPARQVQPFDEETMDAAAAPIA